MTHRVSESSATWKLTHYLGNVRGDAQVAAVNTKLDALQKQINSMISRINTAATIVSDIAKVLAVAAKVIPGA